MMQTTQNESVPFVPLSHVYIGGTVGQTYQSGTGNGTTGGTRSLKAIIQARLNRPTHAGQVGQERDKKEKCCPTPPCSSGTKGGLVPRLSHLTMLDPLPMDWTPDRLDGLPICYLPNTPERLRGLVPPDLRGMGVPAEGLPLSLRSFSIGGWSFELAHNGAVLRRVHPLARMESGLLKYFAVNRIVIATDLRRWLASAGKEGAS